MTDTITLPAGFEDLTELAAHWARATENARSAIRWSASAQDFAAFYTAFMPRLRAFSVARAQCAASSVRSVSYTHLTLPTILLV